MIGLPRFGPSDANKGVLFADFHILLHSNNVAEQAQALDVNTLHNDNVIEDVMQLTVFRYMNLIFYDMLLSQSRLGTLWTDSVTVCLFFMMILIQNHLI